MKKRCLASMFVVVSMLLFLALSFSLCFSGEPKSGGTLRIGTRMAQYNKMDARYLTTDTMVPITSMIYDPLFAYGEKGLREIVPALATGIQTEDNRVWTIHLRRGVKFHNGREMTAEDVKANFDWRIETPKGWKPVKYSYFLKGLKKAEVIDRYTVRITLEQPFVPFSRVVGRAIRGIVPPEELEKWGKNFTTHPCGTGPFKVVEVKPKEKIVVERFEDYWGPRPFVDRVEYKPYRSNDSRLIALQKGEIDIAPLFDEAKPVLDKDPNLAYEEIIHPMVLHKMYFNLRRWPMNDIRFRKAVWMGADWKNIVINAFAFKSGNYARTHFEYTKYFNPDALKLVPPFNPEEARRLIQAVEKDAGRKIPPIYWLDSNWSPGRTSAEAAKLQLARIGIPLNLNLLSHAIW
ncbi:MAG: ABC transporter substrate-binding protein, partial [Deltaproteobacteria bacterium]|nr:ABC transporter substrate-binding protein [Deltaproteobacteria bacterium]